MRPCELRLCLSLVGFCAWLLMGAVGEFIIIFELICDSLQFFEKMLVFLALLTLHVSMRGCQYSFLEVTSDMPEITGS